MEIGEGEMKLSLFCLGANSETLTLLFMFNSFMFDTAPISPTTVVNYEVGFSSLFI